jgi:gliding motility-associated-like protein
MHKKLLFFFAAIIISNYCFSYSNKQLFCKNYRSAGDSIKITIPNIFTPNNDGKNDIWNMIVTDGLEIFDMKTNIYNRWGKQVFESTNIYQNWNGYNVYEGSLCSDGTYFYVISFTDGNTNQTKTLRGFLELVK